MHLVRRAAVLAAIWVVTPVLAQPQNVLNLQRPLTAVEIETVAGGILHALDGKTLRLVQIVLKRGADSEVLMGQAGMPHVIRVSYECVEIRNGECVAGRVPPRSVPERKERFVRLTEYTGVPARRCDGMPSTGEMVIHYVQNSTTQVWTATARERVPGGGALLQPLDMLRTTTSLASGERRMIGSRTARAILKRHPPPEGVLITGDPAPNPAEFAPVESLWIDTGTLLPVRWEAFQRQAMVAAIDFVYEPLDLQPPAGVKAPSCIP